MRNVSPRSRLAGAPTGRAPNDAPQRMDPKTEAPPAVARQDARISFERLRERTDELELLISGLCLVGLLAVPGWLLSLYAEYFARLPVLLLAASATALPMLIAIAYALAACLILHLVVRAYWVGLIGLRAVFPDGIDWNSPSIGPVQRGRLQHRLPHLDAAIARADGWASTVFAVFVLAALVLACVGFWTTLIFVVAALLGGQVGGTNRWINIGINAFVASIIVGPLLLWLADGMLARRWPALAGWRLFRWPVAFIAGVLGVLFPERLVGPVRLALQSHAPRAVFLPLFAVLVLGVPWAGLSAFRGIGGIDRLGTQTRVQGADLRQGLRSAHYESLRTPVDGLRPLPLIPAPIQQADWLPLFLPYVAMRDDPLLAHRCAARPADAGGDAGPVASADSDAAALAREAADRARTAAASACLATLWSVTLNGAPVALDRFIVAERADLGLRGLAGFIDLRGQTPGPQTLDVVWRPRPETDPPLDDYLPERQANAIPFVWSPSD